MAKPKIAVIGSSNTDMIIQLKKIPAPGETIIGERFSIAAGGKGANQAVAAARAGGDVSFIACVGNDMFGEQALNGFESNGIDIEFVFQTDEVPSGVAFIFVDQQGENSIGVAAGANALLMPSHIKQAEKKLLEADIWIMQLETPVETVLTAVRIASVSGKRVILNPAPAGPLSDELLENISILTLNESEAEFLTGINVTDQNSAERAASLLLSKGIGVVLITMGAQGVYLATSGIHKKISGFAVNAVDTTGAGDVFNGALAVALCEEKSLTDAVIFANAAAALSVQKLGAQSSIPGREEIDSMIQ